MVMCRRIEMTDEQIERLIRKARALMCEILKVASELTKDHDARTLRTVMDELLLQTIANMSKLQVSAVNEATGYAAKELGSDEELHD